MSGQASGRGFFSCKQVGIALGLLLCGAAGNASAQVPSLPRGSGVQHSLELQQDGTVLAWGGNDYGQLGDGTLTRRLTPVQVRNLSDVTAIATGGYHGLALEADGTLWAWGNNNAGQVTGDCKRLGNQKTPVQVSNVPGGVVALAGGGNHSLALTANGTVWAWGINIWSQTGVETREDCVPPVSVRNLTGVVAIAAGKDHSLALKADGTVWAWGYNSHGQLGDGTSTQRALPVQVQGLTDVVAVAASGYHSMALRADGTVWGWGSNDTGYLGNGTFLSQKTPVQVQVTPTQYLTGAVAISTGMDHALALKADGTVWAWGSQLNGRLGNSATTGSSNRAIQVPGFGGVVDVTTGWGHSLARLSDGTLWAWGLNDQGQLGTGTQNDSTTPVQLSWP